MCTSNKLGGHFPHALSIMSNQVSFRITLPKPTEKLGKYYLYVNNRGQVYIPNRRGLFGGAVKALPTLKESGRVKTEFEFDFHLKKIVWKALSTDKMPCDKDRKSPDTSKCITSFLERETGCSMNLLESDPNVPRCVQFFDCYKLSLSSIKYTLQVQQSQAFHKLYQVRRQTERGRWQWHL